MSKYDFHIFPSWGREVIECISPRAESFFETYCRDHSPSPLRDESAYFSGRRRFINDDLDSDGRYVRAAVTAAEEAGLVEGVEY